MHRLLSLLAVALGVLIGMHAPAQAQSGPIYCGSKVLYDASTNGRTQLVAATAGQTVYICGFDLFSGGTVNVSLGTGTGSNCATTYTAITPAWQFVAQTGIVDASSVWRGLSSTVGEALCLSTSAGVAVQAIVFYTKF